MTKKELAKVKAASGPPAAFAAEMAEDAGLGVSTDKDDNLVPFIYVLQALSPQVNKRNEDVYVDGAEPGDILLRNASNPVIKGEEGVLFQPCAFYKEWVEWVPLEKGGGMVGRTKHMPDDAKPDPQNPYRFMRPNGNEVVETRYHAGFVLRDGSAPMPYVIPFKSTGHKISKGWTTLQNSFLDNGKVPSSWSRKYRLTTRSRTNAAGTWFVMNIDDADWVDTAEDYARGKALHLAFASGDAKAEEETTEGEATDDAM